MKIELKDLPNEPEAACIYVVEWFEKQFAQTKRTRFTISFRNVAFRNFRILETGAKRLNYAEDLRRPLEKLLLNLQDEAVTRVRANLEQIRDIIEVHRLDAHFSGKPEYFGDDSFSLDSEEVEAILQRTSEMRFIISNSDFFDPPHKKRLLERLSQVEFEMYRENGKFDTILGGVVDFGDALGKFGQRVKPLVDRMSEIRKITQDKTSAYEELPPPEETKRLPPPNETDDESTD
ncbi:MAG: hypothetical protein ABJQ80_00955 [Lentilitoribacter sp.]